MEPITSSTLHSTLLNFRENTLERKQKTKVETKVETPWFFGASQPDVRSHPETTGHQFGDTKNLGAEQSYEFLGSGIKFRKKNIFFSNIIIMPPKSNYKKKVRRPLRRKYTRKSAGVTASTVRKIVKSVTAKQTETKVYENSIYDQQVGQVNNDLGGYLTIDLTPTLAQGTIQQSRVGLETLWTSAHYDFQLTEQSVASTTDASFKFMLILDKCPENNDYNTEDPNNPVETMFKRNNFIRTAGGGETDIRDYSSSRSLIQMERFRVLATKKLFVKADNIQSTSNRVRNFSMGLKFKKPMKQKYSQTTASSYVDSSAGRVFLAVFCSSGNVGNATSTLTGIPRGVAECGYNLSLNNKAYFKDF
ncbi:hypothetical protein [Flavobacterium sp.]|uniref:hypothetical protein n=3 Tax=Flavobacterium sp. TaxID=239 RepID=UPI004048E0AF